MPQQKSTAIAYFLFFTGGIFAWHLLYLKRSRHAVLYLCTFGGYGLGLLYDLMNIPRYVSEANLDEDYVDMHLTRRRQRRLDVAWERCAAQVVFGCLLGYSIMTAFPRNWTEDNKFIYYCFVLIIMPLFTSYGVWFIGGIGSSRLDFSQALLGAVLTIPLLIRSGPSNIFYTAMSSAIWANYRGNRLRALEELNLEQKQSYLTHFVKVGIFLTIVYSLWLATCYHNVTLTTHDGVEVPLSEAISNFINSQAFRDLKTALADFFFTLFSHGLGQAWHKFIKISDPLGEDSAFKTLELEPGASESQIEKQCRKLLREHHPDRYLEEDLKRKAHAIFLDVQVACDRLSIIRQRRIQRNKQSVIKEEL